MLLCKKLFVWSYFNPQAGHLEQFICSCPRFFGQSAGQFEAKGMPINEVPIVTKLLFAFVITAEEKFSNPFFGIAP
jgi:hypothetical protein